MQHYWFKSSDAAVDRFTFRVRKILVHPRLIPKVTVITLYFGRCPFQSKFYKLSNNMQVLACTPLDLTRLDLIGKSPKTGKEWFTLQ